MTLKELLTIADRSYPEGWVLAQWDDEAGKLVSEPQGEPLAYWIARELEAIYDAEVSDETLLITAAEVIDRAVDELRAVSRTLSDEAMKRSRPEPLGGNDASGPSA